MKKTEIAWAAGFFDGEGCTQKVYYHYKTKKGIKKPPSKHIKLTLSQACLEPLSRFKKAIGNKGRINGPYKYKAQKRPYWVWSISCNPAIKVFNIIKPYLSSAKKKQFKIVNKEISLIHREKGWVHDKR